MSQISGWDETTAYPVLYENRDSPISRDLKSCTTQVYYFTYKKQTFIYVNIGHVKINTYISEQEEMGVTGQRLEVRRLIAIRNMQMSSIYVMKQRGMLLDWLLIKEDWEREYDDPPTWASEHDGHNNASRKAGLNREQTMMEKKIIF